MTLKEKFIKKVDEEYQVFLDKIGKYSGEEIAAHSKEITIYQIVHHYMHNSTTLSDKEIEYLIKFENPIRLIGDHFYWSKIELIRMADEACTFVTKHKMNYKSVL